ncbi:Rossmann-fold NAD(P)-binding domain-containing protein [Streptomyces triticirhizae]|uniref:Saccharopine dehydrogenase n=1 Tax=Streptomyces triticirhizae TaxID=2483353 RepID=A0A3M2LPH5_9ACTN|nr:saccharopine dehydrogenase [Streptomyces triticirhizae]RMI39371.1 saccharopine dehydrogenase [Streptomyces triticirhizae]
MPRTTGVRLRAETAPNERRTPLVPTDAASLVADGLPVTVEESPQRAFSVEEYTRVGCRVAPAHSWPDAGPDEVVLGLKEPAGPPDALTHRHVFFGHAYRGQRGGPALLRRFTAGGGTLLDLEYLTEADGRRVTAFGEFAGYVGAALAVLHQRRRLTAPLTATTRPALDARLREHTGGARALVIGALGRSGRGARRALDVAGVPTTGWDQAETADLDRPALRAHDLLVNAVAPAAPGPPFLTPEDLPRADRALTVVADVTCDVTSARNRLPVNDRTTDWERPVRRLHSAPPLDVIAIDNLPSLLPRESSAAFSAGLLPHLRALPEGSAVWDRSAEAFRRALATTDDPERGSDG